MTTMTTVNCMAGTTSSTIQAATSGSMRNSASRIQTSVSQNLAHAPNFAAGAFADVLGLDGDGGLLDFDELFMMMIRKHLAGAYVEVKVLKAVDVALQLEMISEFGVSMTGGVDIYPNGMIIPFWSWGFDVNGLKNKFELDVDKAKRGKWRDNARDYKPFSGDKMDDFWNGWRGPKTKGSNAELKRGPNGDMVYDYRKAGWTIDKKGRVNYHDNPGIRRPRPFTGPDNPKLSKNGFGIVPFEMALVAIQLELGFKGGIVLRFPGFSVKVPEGAEWSFDLLAEDHVQATVKPEFQMLHGAIELKDPTIFANVMAGPKVSFALSHNFMKALPQNLNPTIGMGIRGDLVRFDLSLWEKKAEDGQCEAVEGGEDSGSEDSRGPESSSSTLKSTHASDPGEGRSFKIPHSSATPTAEPTPFPDFGNDFPGTEDSPQWSSYSRSTQTLGWGPDPSHMIPSPPPKQSCLPWLSSLTGQVVDDDGVIFSPDTVCLKSCDPQSGRLNYIYFDPPPGVLPGGSMGRPGFNCATMSGLGTRTEGDYAATGTPPDDGNTYSVLSNPNTAHATPTAKPGSGNAPESDIEWPQDEYGDLVEIKVPSPDGSGQTMTLTPDTATITAYDAATGEYTYALKSDPSSIGHFSEQHPPPDGVDDPYGDIGDDDSDYFEDDWSDLDRRGEDPHAIGISGVFRTGVYIYAQAFSLVIDSNWIGQLDNKPEGTRGLYWSIPVFAKSWCCHGYCVGEFINKVMRKVTDKLQNKVDILLEEGVDGFSGPFEMLGLNSTREMWLQRLAEGRKAEDDQILNEELGVQYNPEETELTPNQQWKRDTRAKAMASVKWIG